MTNCEEAYEYYKMKAKQEAQKSKEQEIIETYKKYIQMKGDNTKLVVDNKGVHLIVGTPLQSKQEDFEAMAKATETYLQKWGHPHMTIIARLDGIEVVEGVQVKPFTVLD